MPDQTAEARTGESLDRWGPTAIMSYISMVIFAATIAGVYWSLWNKIEINGLMGTLIGSVLTATYQNAAGALNFWTGGNIGAKQASNALAKLAGSPNPTITAPLATSQTIVNPPANAGEFEIPEPPGEPRRE